MPNNTDVTMAAEAIVSPPPRAVEKILDAAIQHGWTENPAITLVVRLSRPQDELALPFFMRWDLVGRTPTRKLSWRFQGARAANGQPLTVDDALLYMQDPSVIYPSDPLGDSDA